MNWPFRPIPETADLSPAEQRRWWTDAGRDRSRTRDLFAVAFVLFVVGGVSALLLVLGTELLPSWARWPLTGLLFVGGSLIIDAVLVAHRRRVVRRLRGGGPISRSSRTVAIAGRIPRYTTGGKAP